jgi:hypothetical protein
MADSVGAAGAEAVANQEHAGSRWSDADLLKAEISPEERPGLV